jgi:DNA polymerase-4
MSARSILHVDMDAFFAAVEVLDNPSLAGKPVIVGGTPEGHGVVSTASYEARKYGVRSAMPAALAVKLCPGGIFLEPRGGRYAAVSRQVFRLFEDVTPLVEPISIDEAFLDVTGCRPSGRSPTEPEGAPAGTGESIARDLQKKVEVETGGLTCSIGVAENKFLAKVASDLRKPRGLVFVPPGRGAEFLAPLEIERLWGVGPKTAAHLHALGLRVIGDIANVPEKDLSSALGQDMGQHLHRLALGIDERPVETNWEAKSMSQETTFATFLAPGDRPSIERTLFELADGVAFRLRQDSFWGRTVHLKVRDEKFTTFTRALTLDAPTQVVEDIFAAASKLFRERIGLRGRKVRLLGVGVTNLTRSPCLQLDFFEDRAAEQSRAQRLARVADAICEKMGDGAITRARLMEGKSGHKKPDRKRRRHE